MDNCIGLLLVSAVLYNGAFILPSIGWSAIFYCYIPLFIVCLRNNFSYKYLLIWTVFIYSIQWFPWAVVISERAAGSVKYMFIGSCFVGAMIIAATAAWGMKLVARLMMPLYLQLLGYSIVWLAYLEFMYRSCFIWHGYPFGYPLVPLAVAGKLLAMIVYLPSSLLLFFLVAGQMWMAATWVYKNKRLLIVAIFCGLPFITGIFMPVQPFTFARIVGCKPPHCSGNPLDDAQAIARSIMDAGNAEFIIFPESTFCYDALLYPHLLQLWQEHMSEGAQVIVGTQVTNNGKWHVAACCLTKERVAWHYKQCLVPLAEYLPTGIPAWWYTMLLEGQRAFTPALYAEDASNVLICAELFLSKQKPIGDEPLIVIANDSWCRYWLADQLRLFACFKAIEWKRVILYCSHTGFFDEKGCIN